MDYRESSPIALAQFFEAWDYYKTINSLHARPASERFQAFKAAWTWYDANEGSNLPYVGESHKQDSRPPPEYDMLRDWLAAEASGFWEPVE